jgi:hypothetical protein
LTAFERTIQESADLNEISFVENFPTLRAGQRLAFGLLERERGFLWGPPGTGKTFTLGAMLAHFLCKHPNSRVLLLSTTNSAVDLALISVDERLEELSRKNSHAGLVRKQCLRIGNHFVASKYRGREHLLPVPDEDLICRLADLLFSAAGIASLMFITVRLAPYRSAKEIAYLAASLGSGTNSNGYKMCRSSMVAFGAVVRGPIVKTGHGATLNTSSATEPNSSFLNARRP